MEIPSINQDKLWEFKPREGLKVGSLVSGGDILGNCFENNLFDEHRILLHPKAKGRVTYIAAPGNYSVKEKILEVEIGDKKETYGMSHFWPVRDPRPFAEKLVGEVPLLTG